MTAKTVQLLIRETDCMYRFDVMTYRGDTPSCSREAQMPEASYNTAFLSPLPNMTVSTIVFRMTRGAGGKPYPGFSVVEVRRTFIQPALRMATPICPALCAYPAGDMAVPAKPLRMTGLAVLHSGSRLIPMRELKVRGMGIQGFLNTAMAAGAETLFRMAGIALLEIIVRLNLVLIIPIGIMILGHGGIEMAEHTMF